MKCFKENIMRFKKMKKLMKFEEEKLTDETRLAKLMPEKIEVGAVSRGKTNMKE